MVAVASPLVPHDDANMRSVFVTSYDKDYTPVGDKSSFVQPVERSSGHTSNRPVFGHPPSLGMGTSYNAFHGERGRTPLNADQWGVLTQEAAKPQIHATAFVRDVSKVGVQRNEQPTISTTKSTFTNSGDVSTCKPAHYSGDAQWQYTRDLLFIPASLGDDDNVGKAKRGNNNTTTSDLLGSSSGSMHPGRLNLIHQTGPGSYFQHSRLIGDRTLAKPGQLPSGIADASDSGLTQTLTDKKVLLNTLAGRRQCSTAPLNALFETNPISMTKPDQERCRVSRRVEAQGNVRGTTYSAHYVDQKYLPEVADPAKEKRAQAAVVLPNVQARPHQSINLKDSRGNLLEERPAGIHPAVWNRLKAVETSLAVDKVDPHAHKLRSIVLR